MSVLDLRVLVPVVGLVLPLGWAATPADGKKHRVEEEWFKSSDQEIGAKLTFSNKSGQPVKVFWLDHAGERKFYKTLEDGEKYDQETFLGHGWLVADADDNAWSVYFPDGQPRTVEIAAPKK